MTPYPALWRVNNIPGRGVEYRAVAVVSAPIYGHVKCVGLCASLDWAVPLAELVGAEGDGYASQASATAVIHARR